MNCCITICDQVAPALIYFVNLATYYLLKYCNILLIKVQHRHAWERLFDCSAIRYLIVQKVGIWIRLKVNSDWSLISKVSILQNSAHKCRGCPKLQTVSINHHHTSLQMMKTEVVDRSKPNHSALRAHQLVTRTTVESAVNSSHILWMLRVQTWVSPSGHKAVFALYRHPSLGLLFGGWRSFSTPSASVAVKWLIERTVWW